MNSPQIQNDVNMDSLRYSREQNHPIGFGDRHLFSTDGETPRYLFMRPFDSSGSANQEAELILWMKKKDTRLKCVNQGMQEDDCLKSFLDRISFENQVILIPIISQNYISLAKNLDCSLARLGYTNVVLWTLDQKIHHKITNLGLNSLYEPLNVTQGLVDERADFKREFSERKVSIILRFIKNGYDVIYVDPASVVLKDFFKKLGQYAHNSYHPDIMLGTNGDSVGNTEPQNLDILSFRTNFFFARKTSGTISLFERIKLLMDLKLNSDFEDAFNSIARVENMVQITGLGEELSYPGGNQQIVDQDPPALPHLFNLGFSKPKAKISRIHVLDQSEFVGSKLFFSKMDSSKESVMLVYASNEEDAEKLFKTEKLWYLDSQDICMRN